MPCDYIAKEGRGAHAWHARRANIEQKNPLSELQNLGQLLGLVSQPNVLEKVIQFDLALLPLPRVDVSSAPKGQ